VTFEALLQENTSLKSDIQSLQSSLQQTRESLDTTQNSLDAALSEQERLKLVVKSLQHRLFGKSSERRVPDSAQGNLFEQLLSQNEEQEPEKKKIKVAGYEREEKTSSTEEQEAPEGTFPEYLERREQVIDEKSDGVSEEDLELIGEKITERLGTTPEEHYVDKIVRKTYKVKSSGLIHTPPAPEHVFDHRCKVNESFLVMMLIKKFLWHIPLHRQEKQLRFQGIKLSRQSLIAWTIKLAELLRPIANAIAEDIRESDLIHGDETPFIVNRSSKNKGQRYQEGYLWPILNLEVGVAFIYGGSREHHVAQQVLKDSVAVIVSDAYGAWEEHVKAYGLLWQLCWMHIRRNFVEAEESNPQLAGVAIDLIRKLYEIEKSIKFSSPEKKSKERVNQSKPVLDEFKNWLGKIATSPEVLTDPRMSKAVNYVLPRWEAATLFLYDGSIPIDNGPVERAIRPVKLGAKNWLFAASEIGAEAVGIHYTLINSALMHGIHPYYYLMDVFKRIYQKGLSPGDLTPAKWKQRFFDEAVPEHLRNIKISFEHRK
jgi:transposase